MIQSLPPELIHYILQFLDYPDWKNARRASRIFHTDSRYTLKRRRLEAWFQAFHKKVNVGLKKYPHYHRLCQHLCFMNPTEDLYQYFINDANLDSLDREMYKMKRHYHRNVFYSMGYHDYPTSIFETNYEVMRYDIELYGREIVIHRFPLRTLKLPIEELEEIPKIKLLRPFKMIHRRLVIDYQSWLLFMKKSFQGGSSETDVELYVNCDTESHKYGKIIVVYLTHHKPITDFNIGGIQSTRYFDMEVNEFLRSKVPLHNLLPDFHRIVGDLSD